MRKAAFFIGIGAGMFLMEAPVALAQNDSIEQANAQIWAESPERMQNRLNRDQKLLIALQSPRLEARFAAASEIGRRAPAEVSPEIFQALVESMVTRNQKYTWFTVQVLRRISGQNLPPRLSAWREESSRWAAQAQAQKKAPQMTSRPPAVNEDSASSKDDDDMMQPFAEKEKRQQEAWESMNPHEALEVLPQNPFLNPGALAPNDKRLDDFDAALDEASPEQPRIGQPNASEASPGPSLRLGLGLPASSWSPEHQNTSASSNHQSMAGEEAHHDASAAQQEALGSVVAPAPAKRQSPVEMLDDHHSSSGSSHHSEGSGH